MYKAEFHPKVDKEISRLEKSAIKALRDLHIPRILKSPNTAGKNLQGNLASLKSYRFLCNKVEYRIIYDIIEDRVTVLFIMVGARENIYKRLLNRIGSLT